MGFKFARLLSKNILKVSFTFESLRLCAFALMLSSATFEQTLAPGSPGKDAQWASAGKQGIGTSASLESKVWFTLGGGALTEVYYPDVTTANVHKLEFVVVDPKTRKVETETDDAKGMVIVNGDLSKMSPLLKPILQERMAEFDFSKSKPGTDALYFSQVSSSKTGKWFILKSYVTDPQSHTVMVRVRFIPLDKDLQLYVYYDPSLANSGMHDTAWNEAGAFLAQDGDVASALIFSSPLSEMSNGFYQSSDGLEQLKLNGRILTPYTKAENGNVVQIAKVNFERRKEIDFALSFGKTPNEALQTAKDSLAKGFDKTLAQYTRGWSDYVKTLPKVDPKYQPQFNMAAMQLKAHEDKTHRGANIASLTVPWGGGDSANEKTVGGYHLVWSRDLYQVATAFMAIGDTAAANRALDFVFNVQQKPDGSVPQNSWLDGKPFWGSLQLDEVAFPLILAYQLKRFDRETYENHVKRAANFIVKNGPVTPQERWEERSGYSPSTLAAEIAGLVCAAEIARRNGDEASTNLWLKTADEWQANIEKWTATTNGKYGDGNYYLRITQKGNPNAGDKIDLGNGAGSFDEREIIDAGFLELVRLGIKSPDDPLIVKSLKVVDQIIKVNTPNGEGFYRYNHDGYGEMDDGRRWNFDGKYTGKGRLWALLSGERGQYELAFANSGQGTVAQSRGGQKGNPKSQIPNPKSRLDAMLAFANDGLMIPEQTWDRKETPPNIDKQFIPELKFGEGTGSATPLAWSMAQFIRLAVNLKEGRNLDTPDVVYNRYIMGKKDNIQKLPKATEFNELNQQTQSPLLFSCENSFLIPCNNPKHEMHVCFNFDGQFKTFAIAGDFTGWKPKTLNYQENDQHVIMQCFTFAKTARVEYKLIVDGKWITDPLNANKVDNGVGGENSFFTMPDYQPTGWDKNTNDFTSIETLTIDSKIYGGRTVKVYNPFIKSDRAPLPVLYLQDGSDYINRAKAVQIQQNLVRAGKIKPFIMVFVDYKDRMKEYWTSDDYARFLATEVVPAIDAKYRTVKLREGRAILGVSLGGVTSVHTALKYPEIFGRVGGQSSSFWIDNERVIKELQTLDGKTKFQFYFDVGTLEAAENNRKAVEILKKKGFDVTYREGETGHNWTAWRDRLADAFMALWK